MKMKFYFEVRETLSRYITIDADNMMAALNEVQRKLDDEDVVLDSSDFIGGELRSLLTEPISKKPCALPYVVNENDEKIPLDSIVLDVW